MIVRWEQDRKREVQGNGPVVRFEVQEDRGLDEAGERCWYVHSDHNDAAIAMDATRAVRAMLPRKKIRLAKVITEVMEVE